MIDRNYREHQVFIQLPVYADFYEGISDTAINTMTYGIEASMNIDAYAFTSIRGTIESIHDILFRGRINDAYALLRKYHDSIMINTYTALYLTDNFSIDNFVVEKIDNWLKAKEQLPEYRVISNYIRASDKLKTLNDLLYNTSDRYAKIRARCNDHTHYNFYHNMVLNDNEIYLEHRLKMLDRFAKDIEDLFILHFGYLFSLNETYMSSDDYVGALDVGQEPVEGSQYYVAPFVQTIFDKIVKVKRPDIAAEIMKGTIMELE